MHIVGDENDRHAVAVELQEKLHNIGIVTIVLPRRRLVKNNDFGVDSEYRRDGDSFFLPEAQCAYGPVSEGIKPAYFKGFLHLWLYVVFRTLSCAKSGRDLVHNHR